MRGLDPRIHTALPRLRGFSMDRRVKPGGDEDGRNGSVATLQRSRAPAGSGEAVDRPMR
jgi:hypothetical protein